MIKAEGVKLMCLVTECVIVLQACHQGGGDQTCTFFPCTFQSCICVPRYRKV